VKKSAIFSEPQGGYWFSLSFTKNH
jgi:hypothetical protein